MGKHGGGVRPIAVGCTLRRLVAKIACGRVVEDMSCLFSPHQLGFRVRGGIEAAVHAGCHFLHNISPGEALIKLDFSNAFNSVRWDCMLRSVLDTCPSIFPLVCSAYSSSSSLFWEDKVLLSAEGVQQGNPLGPLLFCLTLHQFIIPLKSSFHVAYLDDLTLGGSVALLREDVLSIKEAVSIGLVLNLQKSEIISDCSEVIDSLHGVLPGAEVISPRAASLLGSPIGNTDCLSSAVADKISALRLMGDRLLHFALYDSMLRLHYSFSLPHLLFILHTSPAFLSPKLKEYDTMLCSLLSSLLNVSIDVNCPSWIQASSPIRLGGLGLWSAEQLAPSCYLSSAAASRCLVNLILSTTSLSQTSPHSDEALSVWSSKFPSLSPPAADKASIQKEWDNPQVLATLDHLLDSAPDEVCLARLTAVSAPEAGAWLQSLLCLSLLLASDSTILLLESVLPSI